MEAIINFFGDKSNWIWLLILILLAIGTFIRFGRILSDPGKLSVDNLLGAYMGPSLPMSLSYT